ncbi:MAG TPA: DsrE family protein [Candidatus Melainabacteria bacterium]|nr:DsrE family protein [Candidatus Melainabacteria bacterium]HMP52316.1 DsrE family protein [Candidatus Melainabacteria bacterium]
MKTAVMVYADPKAGTEEALGRLFNALATTYEFKEKGDDVTLMFQGAGSRWIGELSNEKHPAFALFEAVRDKVAGVSCGCADVFGATEAVEKSGFDLIKDNPIPSTSGLTSIRNLIDDGYTILNF